jgi:predicted nucleotidyltransferase
MNREELLDILLKNEQQLKAKGVKLLGVFGSFARDEQTDKSDVDLIVEFEAGKKSYKRFIELTYFLEDTLNRKVELLTQQSVTKRVMNEIEKDIKYVTLGS